MRMILVLCTVFTLQGCSPEMMSEFLKDKGVHLLVIGDSQSSGAFSENGTAVKDSTLFIWNKTGFITGTNATGFYPLMAEHITGNLYVMNEAEGGSDYVKDWGSKGLLYNRTLQRANTYIVKNREFDFIFLAVGGWDALRSEPLDSIKKEMCWVVNNLQQDFPETKILLSKAPGGDDYSTKMRQVRAIEDSIIKANPNIYEAYDIGKLVDEYGPEEIGRDSKHLKQKWSDTVGKYNGKIINILRLK
jgi:hypothetical protein